MVQLPTLTEADFDALKVELCERSFADFVKQAWPVLEPETELKWNWSMDAICIHLQAVVEGKIQKLLINVPPGTMKSMLTSVFLPAWMWGPKNQMAKRIMGTSYEEKLAIRDSTRMRELVKSKWYQDRWPMQFSSATDGKREFHNNKTGWRLARSFFSTMGKRADVVIVDDPISIKDSSSITKLKNAEFEWLQAIPTRLNDQQKSAIIVIMQRVHENDVSGIILEKGQPFVHLMIPMRFEEKRRCTTSIGWTDPRTEEGELMFSERFPENAVVELEETLQSYGTACQLQQRPAPPGGGILKTEWFDYWVSTMPPKTLWRIIVADTAMKTEEENDYSVLQVWGMLADGRIALLDQSRGKWESPDLEKEARRFWNKHRAVNGMGPLRKMFVEDKASGTGLIQSLKRIQKRGGVTYPKIPIEAVQRNTDKITRARSAAPQIEIGNVVLPGDAPWLRDFINETENFPKARNDDQADCLFDAVEKMLGGIMKPIPAGSPDDLKGPCVVKFD